MSNGREARNRPARNRAHKELHDAGHAAGLKAGQDCTPTPVQWQDAQTGRKFAPEPEGLCGFAWINVKPGNCSFAIWAKRELKAHKDYYGGVSIWCREFNQSHERKVAYARAYADVLQAAGLRAYAGERLD